MLDAFASVVGLRVGFDFAAGGLKAEQRPGGGVRLAHHVVGLAGQFQRDSGRRAGFVGTGEGVLGARRGDDEQGAVFELRGVAGLEGGDLGDGGFVAVFSFGLDAGWREGAAEDRVRWR